MTDYIINLITPAVEHVRVLGYWIAFFAAMLETTIGVGLLIPGSTIILLLGAVSARGYLDLGDLVLFSVAGAIIGDNLNYFLGKKYGTRWTQRGIWFLQQAHFEKAKAFFDAHGAKSVFWGRFIPSIKEIMPLIAGVVHMRRRTFLLWNMLGAIGWGFEWILAGYIFAQSLSLAKMWLSRVGFLLATLFLVFLVCYLVKFILLKHGRHTLSFVASVWHSIKHAIITNPDVEKLVQRHAALCQFLAQRMNTNSFSGLPLTLLGVAFFYVLILFGGIVEDVLTGDPIVAADKRIANLLVLFRTPKLIEVFFWITLLGKWQVILSFTIALLGTLWVWRKRGYILPFLLTVVGSAIFTYLGKLAFHRPRPDIQVYAEHSFSFPSGHATLAVAFYGFVTYILIRSTRKWKTKGNLLFPGVIIGFLIGFSRLYLGVHYLSDVWSGYLIGTLWLIIGISLSQWLHVREPPYTPSGSSGKIRFASTILILSSILFYIGFAKQYHPGRSFATSSFDIAIVQNAQDIFSDERMKYMETLTGREQEPMNFIIMAQNDKQLIEIFRKAGWFRADKPTFRSLAKIYKAALLHEPYPTAPVTPLFWNSSVNDFSFEKPTDANNIRERHHVRFWKTKYITKNGKHIYVGTASLDTGVKWGVTHRIDPNIDGEREYLFNDLKRARRLESYKKIQLVKPRLGHNFAGDPFFTDGKAYLIISKSDA